MKQHEEMKARAPLVASKTQAQKPFNFILFLHLQGRRLFPPRSTVGNQALTPQKIPLVQDVQHRRPSAEPLQAY